MHQYSDFSRDVQTEKKLPGSYEWWYFDAVSDDGYALVVIFYDGNPFSRRYIKALESSLSDENGVASNYPAVSISVYKDGKHIFYSFEEVEPGMALFSSALPEVSIAGNTLRGKRDDNGLCYHLSLDQMLPNGDRLTGNLDFISNPDDASGLSVFQKNASGRAETESHEWNLVQPKAEVTGSLIISGYRKEQITFRGTGYHDHNLGREPMKESFEEWYWGRYHFEGCTLVYYLMKEHGIWKKNAWLLGSSCDECEIGISDMGDFGVNPFGLNTARMLQFAGNNISIYLHKDRVADSGPFYQRFLGRAIMKNGNTIQEAKGISEYIRPGRIYNKLFWPLVNMRITYPGKKHWVQKSPVLYRWTW
ncbi:hypothetical protein [Rhodohalobacter mucosus]|uniref:Hydroxyneurosporene synthase (CrtC) n=1 Tax=Rhodohalobacter mucosus TaxID=2079485 RepID=A0A316TXR1_9BACT|nr:hypothetical protein [Rhodohalobacter mucosus]PWN07482.1 hypothetical protein DDZ15_04265 [Rhodohalobacter mucosus]